MRALSQCLRPPVRGALSNGNFSHKLPRLRQAPAAKGISARRLCAVAAATTATIVPPKSVDDTTAATAGALLATIVAELGPYEVSLPKTDTLTSAPAVEAFGSTSSIQPEQDPPAVAVLPPSACTGAPVPPATSPTAPAAVPEPRIPRPLPQSVRWWALAVLAGTYVHQSLTQLSVPVQMPQLSSSLELTDLQGALLSSGFSYL